MQASKVAKQIADFLINSGVTQEEAFCAYLQSCGTMADVMGVTREELISLISAVYDNAVSRRQERQRQ